MLTKVKHLETIRQQDMHNRERIEQDCEGLIRENVILRNQLEEFKGTSTEEKKSREEKQNKNLEQLKEDEKIKSDLIRLKDDLYMLHITVEMKEKEISDLTQKV